MEAVFIYAERGKNVTNGTTFSPAGVAIIEAASIIRPPDFLS